MQVKGHWDGTSVYNTAVAYRPTTQYSERYDTKMQKVKGHWDGASVKVLHIAYINYTSLDRTDPVSPAVTGGALRTGIALNQVTVHNTILVLKVSPFVHIHIRIHIKWLLPLNYIGVLCLSICICSMSSTSWCKCPEEIGPCSNLSIHFSQWWVHTECIHWPREDIDFLVHTRPLPGFLKLQWSWFLNQTCKVGVTKARDAWNGESR